MKIEAHLSEQQISRKIYTSEEIQDWLVNRLAQLLEIEPDEVEVDITFDRYGLDSSAAIGLTGDLADWLGMEIEPTLLYDYPTVEALAQYLGTELAPKS
ncbi:MAG: acyl carrier protein [Gloeobacterales cyanobacterium]|jgi:acyl carrier protein